MARRGRGTVQWPTAVAGLLLAACGAGGHGGNDDGGGDGGRDAVADARGDVGSNGEGGSSDSGSGGTDSGTIRRDSGVDTGMDVAALDGGGIYDDVPVSGDVRTGCDAGACVPVARGCLAQEVCDSGNGQNSGNGVDDNCNGTVDEGCVCVPGQVQRCFNGPPGSRGVGACQDGMQTCQGSSEFGTWGPCEGGITISGEACDSLDNDCNGCADDNLCCTSEGSCPGPGDSRIPTGQPFTDITLHGNDFLAGAQSYAWHVEGGPCDQMLFATRQRVTYSLQSVAAPTPGQCSSAAVGSARDATGETLVFHPTLSGDYTVTLTITRTDGTTLVCTFILPVRAPGFRAELCWDSTGQNDLDLWVHRPSTTGGWPNDTAVAPDSCYYYNCLNPSAPAASSDPTISCFPRSVNWGYPDTPNGACREPDTNGACHNPRLDVDNISTAGIPENINVDAPNNNDTFRVAVNFYGFTGFNPRRPLPAQPPVHPMVNLYCGGELRATYGGVDANGMHFGATAVAGFTQPGLNGSGTVWRVADVTMHEPTDGCDVAPLHPTGTTSGYCVKTDTNRTYDDGCAP